MKPTRNRNKKATESDLRLLPLGIAALLCFIIGVSGGSFSWYFLGSKSPFRKSQTASNRDLTKPAVSPEVLVKNESKNNLSVTAPQSSPENQATPDLPETQPSPEPPKTVLAPAGELVVEGGEIVLGGGDTKLPLRRDPVSSFAIAETEVTNAQFKEFVDATNRKIKLSVGKDDEPVTGVSWDDAKAYCDWLSKKIGVEVRLPTEAEWELAARGKENLKYPWGSEWRDDAAACKENNGKVRPIKSYPNGKSPFGAYDMVGNVWEWTSDAGQDAFGRIAKDDEPDSIYKNQTLYVVKGGAAIESRATNSAQARLQIPKGFSSRDIGFRYVVHRNKSLGNGETPE